MSAIGVESGHAPDVITGPRIAGATKDIVERTCPDFYAGSDLRLFFFKYSAGESKYLIRTGPYMKFNMIIAQACYVLSALAALLAALIYFGYIVQLRTSEGTDPAALNFAIAGILIPYFGGLSLQRFVEARAAAKGLSHQTET